MIVVIVPYSPAGRSQTPHLGAARKIESIVGILGRFGMPVVLVNTAHELETSAPVAVATVEIAGVELTEITPPTYPNRQRGKLRNLFDMCKVADAVLALGKPDLVWLYNGYAMESRLGVELKRRTGCHVIQEMEDWHFSRSRGLNPKPFIDWWFWRTAAKQASHVFAVNDALAGKVKPSNPSVSLFPGIVADGVASIRETRTPFSSVEGILTLGYFGGLSAEKGADSVLALPGLLPENYRVVVTGSGPLQDAFATAAAGSSGRLEFHGRVDDAALIALMTRCDVLLNPHSPIEQMANGVFPFKVIEAIASERLLVSTSLPSDGLEDVLQGVLFVGHGVEALRDGVVGARDWYAGHARDVAAGAYAANARFGKSAILDVVERVLGRAVA